MAEILGLGTTHAPTVCKVPEDATNSLRRTLAGKKLPPHLRDPRNWPEPMQAEWADDKGAAAGREYTRRCFEATRRLRARLDAFKPDLVRSEEHTSELQSRRDLVCRLLLDNKDTV